VWRRVHRNTLESLLHVIVRYYRGLYLFPTLQTRFVRLQEEDMDYVHYLHGIRSLTKEQDLPDDAIVTKNDRDYTPVALDIRALEQLAVDDLVEYFYDDPDISCDISGWGQYSRIFSDKWYTLIFQSSEEQFYLLVCNTFHNHPKRDEVAQYWD
jgi:hypothetical protein